MSGETKNNILTDEEVSQASGGASDRSATCGRVISVNCIFCTQNIHSQHTFPDEGLMDTIGCGLSSGYLGSINDMVLANRVPTQLP